MSSTESKSVRDILFREPARRSDRELVGGLVLLSAGALVAAALLSSPASPRNAFYDGAVAYFGGLVLLMWAVLRVLRDKYSLAGIFWYAISVGLFQLWNGVVMLASALSGWLNPSQAGYRLEISAALGVVPLLVGIWQLGRKVVRAP